jgi:site-specific DNA recombinase
MTPTQACKNGGKRYRYYVCLNALRRGPEVCPARSVAAAAIEQFVVARLHESAKDEAMPAWETLTAEEQAGWIERLVQRVDYDGAGGKLAITFQASDAKAQPRAVRRTEEKQP